MKYFAAAVLLSLFVISGSVSAVQPASKKDGIEQLVKSLSEAYAGKTLASLDAGKPYSGRVIVVIEHSIEDRSERRSFTSFRKVESWLRSREIENMPARQTKELKHCRKGVCTYDFNGGILHNQLYLKKVTYSYSKGRYYIKTITLLDGD